MPSQPNKSKTLTQNKEVKKDCEVMRDVEENVNGLSANQWREKLSEISGHIKNKTQLTLMGSAPNMLRGQPSRMSLDLDVWKPSSNYDSKELKKAVEASGLLFNPTEDIPSKPYIQIVEPGICQLGNFKTQNLEKMGNLDLVCPPIENLIASKLLRSDAKDLEDIAWMCSIATPNTNKVKEIIKTFPEKQKQVALENLVYLEVINYNTQGRSQEKSKEKSLENKGNKRDIGNIGNME